jgi:hypothetical protein
MQRHKLLIVTGLTGILLAFGGLHAQPPANPEALTPQRVNEAIERGVEFLKRSRRDGHWEHHGTGIGGYRGGVTSLVTLALLEAGVSPKDPVITDALAYLRKLRSDDTYVVALQTLALARAGFDEDRTLIKENVAWLKKAMHKDDQGRMAGYSYKQSGGVPDNSNTQFAVLGFWAASEAGVPVEDEVWALIQEYYVRTQLKSGGWPYQTGRSDDRITMTTAGACGLIIAGMQLYKNQEEIRPDGTIRNCGRRQANEPLARALKRIGEEFTVEPQMWRFYNLYGIERAGRLSGQRFFGGHDWYRAGCAYLLNKNRQTAEGSWRGAGPSTWDGNPVIATSFSLLFLSKGKTPVLIHKLMHGPQPRGLVGDWNNDPNDVRNLTEFCSRHLFVKDGRPVPLTWQAFDASKLDAGDPQSVAELLQAPVVFFNGHTNPDLNLRDGEVHLLREYIEQGGFVFVEACCGSPKFDEGFRRLVKRICPGRELQPLSEGHPIWTAAYSIDPRTSPYKLEGVDFGCKTCLVYSPQDLSCYWESNRLADDDRTVLAFRVGANVIAYATGLEPPKDKLTHMEVVVDKPEAIVRNFLHVAQINYGGRDWQPAPRAMRNVMDHLNKQWKIDVILQTKALTLGDPNLPNHKFLYMHGRREFTIPDGHQKLLRQHLENGGLLLADACCGSPQFDKSFRVFIEQMFGRPLEPIRSDDVLFSDRIGKTIQTLQCRTQRGAPYAAVTPQLEGIRLDPKNPKSPWIVVYSKYDLGCALDRHASSDCLGYNHESALELAAQVVLYALKE